MTTAAPTSRSQGPKDLSKYAWLSIAAAVATIGLKGSAALITGSVGLLADAAESVVNLVAAIVALIALKVAIKPADKNHQYGHTKAEYFSAAVEGVMIFVAAAFIIANAVERIINPVMPERLGLGLAISLVAAAINGGVAMVLLRVGRKYRSTTLVADGHHLMTDVVTSAAVLIGIALVAITGLQVLDPVVAILAGVNILWTGFRLIKSSIDGLMDVSLPKELNRDLGLVLDRFIRPGAVEFHAVRTRESGSRRFMAFHVLVPGDWSVQRGHDLCEQITKALKLVEPDLFVTAHLEPIEDDVSYLDMEF